VPRTLTQSNIGGPPPTLPDFPPGGGGGDDRDRPDRGGSRAASITGIIVLMCASTMTFAAFVSAMVVRRGLNNDWHAIGLPRILYWNTAILILSSIAIDTGRRLLRRGPPGRCSAPDFWRARSLRGSSSGSAASIWPATPAAHFFTY
jgi:hypothetical protein